MCKKADTSAGPSLARQPCSPTFWPHFFFVDPACRPSFGSRAQQLRDALDSTPVLAESLGGPSMHGRASLPPPTEWHADGAQTPPGQRSSHSPWLLASIHEAHLARAETLPTRVLTDGPLARMLPSAGDLALPWRETLYLRPTDTDDDPQDTPAPRTVVGAVSEI